jgi:hypothetical protein
MTTLKELVDNAVEELKDYGLNSWDEPHDAISEIADSSVPIYNYDIIQLAAENLELATDEPDIGPAFDGSPTPVNIIAANIYEYLESELWDAWNTEIQPELEILEEEAEEDDE